LSRILRMHSLSLIHRGHVNDALPHILGAYYELRGWDKRTGELTPETLRELALEEYIELVR